MGTNACLLIRPDAIDNGAILVEINLNLRRICSIHLMDMLNGLSMCEEP